MISAIGGAEDKAGEVLLRRLVLAYAPGLSLDNVIVTGGSGKLQPKIGNFAKVSQRMPVIVFTDLDRKHCAPGLIADWRKGVTFDTPNLVIRVAVQEAETWMIADAEGVSSLLGRPSLAVPAQVDDINDPKEWLLRAGTHSARSFRQRFTRVERNRLLQGVEYNSILESFVLEDWNPEAARERSESLDRAVKAIRTLNARLGGPPPRSGPSRYPGEHD
ncbi:DUF4276 family protein [Rathayibacter agropyri]|uniref:DUF4276 family protein n=1 Tax=Rathayibacter agropyri TaxID=1634927 RepID=UPI0015646387|nr:DUF4276 family protein [Rathayibacter agropyri]NRD08540.1 DUF4276 family protein [Rathayibacter agropyri]